MSKKKSEFIIIDEVEDSQYFPVFGSGADRAISKPNLFAQIAADNEFTYADTVADLANLVLDVGEIVYTKGCLSIGDGGHGTFIVEAASGTPDGYSRVLLSSGNHAVLMDINGCVDINQFGIDDLAAALDRANVYCGLNRSRLTGSGNGVLSSAVTLTAPYIDLSFFTIVLDASFPSATAITYQATANDLTSKAIISLRFDGDRDNQISEIIAVKVRATPTPDSIFHIFGKNCNTLLNIDGNVERGEFHVKGSFCNIICLESGDSPDTNVINISGGQFKQAYVKSSSTTSDVRLNCQAQEAGATVYAVEINGNRYTKLSGELRALTYGAVIAGDDAGFTRQSADALVFDNLHIQSVDDVGVPIVDIQEMNYVGGRCLVSFGHYQPFRLWDIPAASFEMVMLDCDYTGYHVTFGSAANSKACAGSYRVIDRGSNASAEAALFDRVGSIDVYFDGSALPIVITSGVTNDVIDMSVESAYITNSVAITHNSVRANVHFRGQHLTPALTGYLAAVGTAGIPRGSNAWNVNTNGLNFFDGSVWKYVTTSTTLV